MKLIFETLGSVRFWIASLSVFAGTFLTVKVGQSMIMPGDPKIVGLFWPHAGLSFAVIALWGSRYLPALFIGLLFGIYVPGIPILYLVGHGLAYTFGAVSGRLFMLQFKEFNHALEHIRDVAILLAGLALAALVSSLLVAIFSMAAYREIPGGEFLRIWFPHWAADGIGILVFAPLLMVWSAKTTINWSNRQFFEVLVWLAILIFFGMVIFGNWAPTDTLRYPLELSLFPIMTWGAIRFGQRGSTTGILIIALMAIWQLLQVFGPEQKYISQSPNFLWAFVGVISVTTLFLGAVIAEIRNRENTASENENRLRAFIQAMPDIACLVREDGHVIDVFSSQKNGYSSHALQLKNRSLRECLPLKLAEAILAKVQICLDTGVVQVLEYSHEVSGRIWWFEGRFSAVKENVIQRYGDAGQRSVIWVAYEITERKMAEAALNRRDSLLHVSSTAINALLTVMDEDQAIREVCQSVGTELKVSRLFLYENFIDTKTGTPRLKCRCEWTQPGIESLSAPGKSLKLDFETQLPEWYNLLREGKIIQGFSREFDDLIQDTLRRRKALSIAWVAVRVENNFWGILGIEDCEAERIWEENELNVLRLLAASFGGFFVTRRNESELIKAKTSADQANAAKSEFLAMMSHEIRTPMNAIIGFADLMNQHGMNEDQREYLKIIQRSGDSLLELINNILDYSKIESRKVELESNPFNIEQVICEVLEMVMVKAKEKSIRLDYKVHGRMPEVLLGDAHRIRQIFLNLVNNAVKFTQEGEIRVEVESTPHPRKKQVRLHCQVIDSGIGIPASKLKKLFQPFTQVDSSTTRKFGGTGLGLVISKRLSERMNGKMWVESEEGKGSTFHFTMDLPYSEMSESAMEEPESCPELSPDFSKKNPLDLLLAEDEPINQMLAQEIFRQLGYSLALAEDGEAAMDAIMKEDYDVVFMDIHMPKMDGLEVTQQVRSGKAGEEKKDQYIIALTAFALEEDRKRCLDGGMNDYLSKPIQVDQIKRSLEKAYQKLK